jgi:hypothetical protein
MEKRIIEKRNVKFELKEHDAVISIVELKMGEDGEYFVQHQILDEDAFDFFPILAKKPSVENLMKFLSSRLWLLDKSDRGILKQIGASSLDPWEILEKSKGTKHGDNLSLNFIHGDDDLLRAYER